MKKSSPGLFRVISLRPMSRCVRLAGATGYALSIYGHRNISKIVHSVRVMVMAMVGRYLYLKESLMASVGKCN